MPPRPPSVTFFCGLLACFSGWNLLHGIFEMNAQFYDRGGGEMLTKVFLGPAIALPCALLMLQGRNPARWAFRLLYTPVAIWLAYLHGSEVEWARVVVCAIGLVVTALTNAHWFFTGRDFKKRMAAKEIKRARRPRPDADSARRSGDYRY